MRTTIRDVAEAAGVSAMAVSSVLNGGGRNVKVSEEKAEIIRRVARELRYQPNNLARSLRNRRTGMVGVVFQHLERLGDEQPYYPQLLNGVMAALFPANYALSICPSLILGDNVGSISDGRFDGVLWCRPDFTEASVEELQNTDVPVVMVHAPPGTVPGVPTFCADNDAAMRRVVQHLLELGHKDLAFVTDPVNAHTVEGLARQDAFLSAALRSGMSAEVLVLDPEGDLMARYVGGRGPQTALVCFSDTFAGVILKRCEELGIVVPDELSVVGFDSSSFCEATRPRLTSVNQPVEQMAYAATLQLLSLIRERSEGIPSAPVISSIYDCGLDVRDSTAPPITHRRVQS